MPAIQNLSSIPFQGLIAGPLQAAVEAQAASAATTIGFIERVGFVLGNDGQPTDQVRSVTFKYSKLDGTDENGDQQEVAYELTVPILTIVPIPFLRIDELTIDFNARITEAVTQNASASSNSSLSSAFKTGANVSFRAGFAKVDANVSYSQNASSTRTTNSSSERSETQDYSVAVHVRATTEAMPKGLSRVLDILESVITEKQQGTSATRLRA